MSAPLLTTKLYIPPVRPELVSRPRLIEQLDAGVDRRLTLVSAPAGIVPADMQGRVFTLLQSATGAMIPQGLASAGPPAGVLSVQTWFLIAGVAMAVMGIGALFVPAITRLDDTASSQSAVAAGIEEPVAAPASAR